MDLLAALPVVLTAAVAGALSGALTRRWLARLRRGAPVATGWCETGLGALWAAVALLVADGVVAAAWAPVLAVLAWLGVAGSATDLLRRRLPNALTVPALPLVVLALVPAGGAAVLRGLVGAVLLGGAYATVHLLVPGSLGAGDVKLAVPVGAAVTGPAWGAPVLVACLAAVFSLIVAGWAAGTGRAHWGDGLPHGPVLLAAALLTAGAGAAVRG
ncbi:prepilin peptidase [Pseudonocardia sp. HH130630-07]|uniref:prepilin peptidase n=1 Tax=Pseudonocardia sp. HH130630-07 TaxID=1690815 RepID=UPI00081538EE|nr:A24 family peptidase [Pseudonocardia sp. HH130630-07]ANY09511.1 hypothetical protein AFB00_28390 [Pseudonocardia sp. HH130630-07]